MRLLTMLLISMVVSGYYFPFSFSVLPQLNTKMALAMLGIALPGLQKETPVKRKVHSALI